jgi:hypothetical protein
MKTPQLYPHQIKFNGREENAIGIFYNISLQVLLEDKQHEPIEIIKELRQRGYETNHIVSIRRLQASSGLKYTTLV